MTPRELASKLAMDAEAVAMLLLPGGSKSGREWEAGSVNGEAGHSLKVCLTGNKAGVWRDFASNDKGGDLIDLWREVKGLTMADTMKAVKSHLGVVDDSHRFEKIGAKPFVKPPRPKGTAPKAESPVMKYLTEERKLTPETIAAFKIGEQPGKILFPYLRRGELVFWKTLGLERPEGKKQVSASKDSEPCLFGWQAAKETARSVILTEGEVDCMSLHQMGFCALSVPFGGGGGNKQQWIEHEFDNLERFDEIFIWMDNDTEGKAAAVEIARRLGEHRCKIVRSLNKDANEMLTIGARKPDFEEECKNAKTLDPEELRSAASYADEVVAEFFPKDVSAKGFPLPWNKTAEQVRLRPAELSIWTGYNGSGKSLMLGYVMLDIMKMGGRACIASMEMRPRKTLRRMVRQIASSSNPTEAYVRRAHDWMGDKLWLFDLVGTAKQERMLSVFAYAAKRYGVCQFVVDSLAKCGVDEDDYNGQKKFVEALSDFAKRFECHVHLVAHPRKGEDEHEIPGKMAVRGSGTITDLCDNVFTVWRNKKKAEEQSRAAAENRPADEKTMARGDAIVTCSKQRDGDWEGRISLWFDVDSYQYLEHASARPIAIYLGDKK